MYIHMQYHHTTTLMAYIALLYVMWLTGSVCAHSKDLIRTYV